MVTINLLMLLIAFVCFAISGFMATGPEPWWRRMISIGLLFLVGSMLRF